jgi:hypothetical protein
MDLLACPQDCNAQNRIAKRSYGENKLIRLGAFRVFRDAADLHRYRTSLVCRRDGARTSILIDAGRHLGNIEGQWPGASECGASRWPK